MASTAIPLRFSPNDISVPHLVTIPFSHYCEVARWALDTAGQEYVEIGYALGCHAEPLGTLRAERNHRSTSSYAGAETNAHRGRLKYATPLLCLPDGEIDRDSWEVLSRYQGHLTDAWRGLFDNTVGPAVRRIAYNEVLHPECSHLFDCLFVGSTERELAFINDGENKKRIRAGVKHLLNVNEETAAHDKMTLEQFFRDCDAFLDGLDSIKSHQTAFPQWWIALSGLCGIFLGCPEYGGNAFASMPLSAYRMTYQVWVGKMNETTTCKSIRDYYAAHRER